MLGKHYINLYQQYFNCLSIFIVFFCILSKTFRYLYINFGGCLYLEIYFMQQECFSFGCTVLFTMHALVLVLFFRHQFDAEKLFCLLTRLQTQHLVGLVFQSPTNRGGTESGNRSEPIELEYKLVEAVICTSLC